MTLTIYTDRLVAAADDGSRTIAGLLLPFGVPGRTSKGTVTARAGVTRITVPDDPADVVLHAAHDANIPIGRATSLEWRDDGLHAAFRVIRTRAGDDALVEAAEGLRAGLSVELDRPVIRAGVLLAGDLDAAGLVTRPAFATANVYALTAADVGDLDDDDTDDDDDTAGTAGTETDAAPAETPPADPAPEAGAPPAGADVTPADDPVDGDTNDDGHELDDDERNTMNAGAPAGIPRGSRTAATGTGRSLHDMTRLLAAAMADPGRAVELADDFRAGSTLFAALSTLDHDTAGATDTAQPMWLGELWAGRGYDRRFTPLFTAGPALTALKIDGFKWDTAPEMTEWAGDGAAVASNAAATAPASYTAKRYAGAHRHPREFVDFPNPEYWVSYFRAMTTSYARLSDRGALSQVIAAATPLVVPSADFPADVPEALVQIVDGALAMVDEATATFAVVAPGLWRDFALTPRDKTAEYLSSALGIEEGSTAGFKIVPGPSTMAAGSVLVGAKPAVQFRELPGSPIRVDKLLDLVNGTTDAGLFGYAATIPENVAALQLVTKGA